MAQVLEEIYILANLRFSMIIGLIYMFSWDSRATKACLNAIVLNSFDEKPIRGPVAIF